jgi:outer membrane protein OmpA-like peptidoglycan-associated protein
MKNYLLILALVSFGQLANAQQFEAPPKNTGGKTCFDEYNESFTARGALPVPDGVHNVVFSLRSDTSCFCGEGKISVKDGLIIPNLMVKKKDGTYEAAKRVLHPKTTQGEAVTHYMFTVFNGMSQTFLTRDYYNVNLFFIDYLKRKVVPNAEAPSPNDIEGKQIVLDTKEKEIIRKAYEGLQFENGKSEIKPTSFPHLNLLATMLVDKKDYKLNINGYTDNVGKPESNMQLSRDRADAVKTYLIKEGVESTRIATDGFGMEFPIADNKTAAGRAKNRRVEFIVVQ